MKPLEIEVYSDVICPWCYLGERRLQRALQQLGEETPVQVRWRAFELNPHMPKEGIPRREYRTRKFGSWERSQALDARVAQAAAAEGLPIDFERMERTPNSFDAHRLIWLAGQGDLQAPVVRGLFRAYFAEGHDVGDPEVLTRIATEAGLDRGAVCDLLRSEIGAVEVRRDEENARRLGIDSVPTFLVNGRYALPGAQPPEVLVSAIRRALGS